MFVLSEPLSADTTRYAREVGFEVLDLCQRSLIRRDNLVLNDGMPSTRRSVSSTMQALESLLTAYMRP